MIRDGYEDSARGESLNRQWARQAHMTRWDDYERAKPQQTAKDDDPK